MNLFIEGLPGSGKSTLLTQLEREISYRAFREGDLSPVSLAWCSLMTAAEYEKIYRAFSKAQGELKKYSSVEDDRVITAYTRILTDEPGFHKAMEEYEIHHGNVSWESFLEILLKRYAQFTGDQNIFESSFFQYNLDTMLLYYRLDEKEIFSFYEKAYSLLQPKFKIIYLWTEDIEKSFAKIARERVDENGRKIWLELLIKYIEETLFGKANSLLGMDGLFEYYNKRQKVELKVIDKIIGKDALVISSKDEPLRWVTQWLEKKKNV